MNNNDVCETNFPNVELNIHKTTITLSFQYNNLYNWYRFCGWTALEINGVKNIPFLSNAV